MKFRSLLLTAAGIGATAAWAAHADSFAPFFPSSYPIGVHGNAYVTLGGGVMRREMPTYTTPITNTGATSGGPLIFSTDGALSTGGGAATFGMKLPSDWSPFGTNLRFELSGGGWQGSATRTGGSGVTAVSRSFALNGTTSITCGQCDTNTTLQILNREFAGTAKLKADFPILPTVTVTPGFGFSGGYQRVHYRDDTTWAINGGQTPAPHFTDEVLRTRRIGGEAGGDVTWQALPSLSIFGGGSIGLFHQHTSFDGNDCQNGTSAAVVCTGTLYRTAVSQTRSAFAYRLSFNLGASYDFGFGTIAVAGFGALDSRSAGVSNPTAVGQVASIVFQHRWSYGAGAMLSLPLF